jgi:uncharacterized membrane protein YukC
MHIKPALQVPVESLGLKVIGEEHIKNKKIKKIKKHFYNMTKWNAIIYFCLSLLWKKYVIFHPQVFYYSFYC